MDDDTPTVLLDYVCKLCRIVYDIKKPQLLLLDLDAILHDTYVYQDLDGFNYHYQSHGYHPLICYGGMTGDLLKVDYVIVPFIHEYSCGTTGIFIGRTDCTWCR